MIFKLIITTKKRKEVLDITELINEKLSELEKESGICHLFLLHTTAALTTGDLDPGTDLDLLDALKEMIPKLNYRHPHDPSHVPDHIISSIIGPSISLFFNNKKLVLGTWQRVLLIELNGPRNREVIMNIF